MGLGPLSLVSLAAARELTIECRRQLLSGLDPLEERKQVKRAQQLAQAKSITFKEAAEKCIESKKPEWKNAKHAQQWSNTLTTYAYPIFGDIAVADVDTDLVLKAIEPIWISKAETASRVRQRIETVLDWARARGYAEGENPARLRGHLDNILAKTAKVKTGQTSPCCSLQTDIRIYGTAARTERKLCTGVGIHDTNGSPHRRDRGAKWKEIDLTTNVWTVPAERMKAGREHRIPLSKRAVAILMSIQSNRNPEEFVFPGWKAGTGLSDGALLALMRRSRLDPTRLTGFAAPSETGQPKKLMSSQTRLLSWPSPIRSRTKLKPHTDEEISSKGGENSWRLGIYL